MRTLTIFLALLLTTAPVLARQPAASLLIVERTAREHSPQQLQRHAPRSAQEAAQLAQQQHKGRVLGVRRQSRDNGHEYYSVKLLGKDGRLRIVEIPVTGE